VLTIKSVNFHANRVSFIYIITAFNTYLIST